MSGFTGSRLCSWTPSFRTSGSDMRVNIDELKPGVHLANAVGVEVMRWTPKDGEWLKQDGKPVGLKLPVSDVLKAGDFRPELNWNCTALVLRLFSYVEIFQADEDLGVVGELSRNPPMRRGQWRCRLLKHDPPGRPGELCIVADTLPLAVCRAALKANKWIWSDRDSEAAKKPEFLRMDGSKPERVGDGEVESW